MSEIASQKKASDLKFLYQVYFVSTNLRISLRSKDKNIAPSSTYGGRGNAYTGFWWRFIIQGFGGDSLYRCSVQEEKEKLTFGLYFGNFSEFYMNNLYFVR